ncbi:hypothetical protein AA637_14420 [Cyanobacterium sp. HL-69]|uniref:hypothetical protein n=1 Tax=unclassified Cyanobacterium TaxID=2629879 RepID=UPI0008524DD7|nr:hypothetical protein [Cyanobacterium sp. IPPAS B-1200]AUC62262.1 hypothetical protein AA637_14420 [Cyanobacterium sp. HL-69]OEJ77349.1 hypothetical protein A5482_06520 [Cyanobacterium sp. IPPAS B-1200]
MNDELRQEYNLRSLQIRKVGEKRKVGENIVKLDSDVAKVFSTSESVNEALRFLIKITKENQLT